MTELKQLITLLKPMIQASLDPVCILDPQGRIVHFNLSAKRFFDIRARSLAQKPVFCDLLKLRACESECQITKVAQSDAPLRLDEAPAARGNLKLRVLLSAVPLYGTAKSPIGIYLTVRDTTGEVILQAKYHKMMMLLEDRNTKITALEARLEALWRARRNAA